MSLSHHIRILAERAFEKQTKIPGHPQAPDMRPFLNVPLPERLILLSLYDTRSMEEIKAAFPWAKETDIRLTSPRIREGLEALLFAIDEPAAWIDPGPLPTREPAGDLGVADPTNPLYTDFPINTRDIPESLEKQLRQTLFPSVPLMLFGAHVPPAVSRMSLQHRALVYLRVVEEFTIDEAMAFMECSERQVKNSLTEMVKALGGR